MNLIQDLIRKLIFPNADTQRFKGRLAEQPTSKELRYKTLQKIFSMLVTTSDYELMTQKVVDVMVEEMDFLGGVLFLPDKENKQLIAWSYTQSDLGKNVVGWLDKPFREHVYPLNLVDNLTVQTYLTRKIHMGTRMSEFISPAVKATMADTMQKFMGMNLCISHPIIFLDKIRGVILFTSTRKESSKEEQEMLQTFSDQVAVAIQNSRLYTSLKEANIQIGLTAKLKEDLLAMASHEFRTPITNIKNMLWMLQKQDFIAKLNDNEKQKFDRLSKAVERLDYVVKNINEMLSATNGNLEEQLHFDSIQIERIIKEVIEDKEIEAKEALVNLVYTEPQNLLPPIEADPIKLQYCLYELITNALKYTDKNGAVTITTELSENSIIIKISDTGKGIPQEHIPTLFHGFDKIDVIHTSQSGMGLGLYIVAKIIELHKGKINIESTVGKGTTFTIELPVQKAVNKEIQPINKTPEL